MSGAVKLDHFGYRPEDAKLAIFSADPGAAVELRDLSDELVFAIPSDGGSISFAGVDEPASGTASGGSISALSPGCRAAKRALSGSGSPTPGAGITDILAAFWGWELS